MKYYIGLSLAATSSVDTGVAIIDEFNNIIFVDKLYRMNDIIYFFDNYSSIGDSEICISLAWDRTMLNGKWRILSKPYSWFRQTYTCQIRTTGRKDLQHAARNISNL